MFNKIVKNLFTFREKSRLSSYPIELYLNPNKICRNLYLSSYHYIINNDVDKASRLLINQIRKYPKNIYAYINLRYIISNSGISNENISTIHKHLYSLKNNINYDHIQYHKTISEIEIRLYDDYYHSDLFIKKYLNKNIKNKLHKNLKPILFWHIPKSAGTSFNDYLTKHYYNFDVFPDYTNPLLFKYILEINVGQFPYLRSNHLINKYFNLELIKEKYYQITVLRDPIKRAISSWNQYYSDPYKRLTIIPQHGSHWRYWPTAEIEDWILRVPNYFANYSTYMFSNKLNVNTAYDYIVSIDKVIMLKEIDKQIKQINKIYNIGNHNEKLNNINKNKKMRILKNEELSSLSKKTSYDIELYQKIESTF